MLVFSNQDYLSVVLLHFKEVLVVVSGGVVVQLFFVSMNLFSLNYCFGYHLLLFPNYFKVYFTSLFLHNCFFVVVTNDVHCLHVCFKQCLNWDACFEIKPVVDVAGDGKILDLCWLGLVSKALRGKYAVK